MPCRPLDGGGWACSRGSRSKQCACGRTSAALCDFPVLRDGKVTTCDVPLCRSCARHIREEFDLCRSHAAETAWNYETGVPRIGPGAPNVVAL